MLLIASKQLFASFPDKPAPCGPQCMTFLPIMSKIGSTRESSESGAPSMNVREPAVAPTTPPDMGASTKRPCCVACTALATSREDDGFGERGLKDLPEDIVDVGGFGEDGDSCFRVLGSFSSCSRNLHGSSS